MASLYSDDEIKLIGQWLRDGLSASGIAGRLSIRRGRVVSRHAIIGIVARNKVLAGIGFERKAGRPRSNMSAAAKTARPRGSARIPDQARRVALAPTFQSQAKASEDNGRTSGAAAPVMGEASRAHGPDRAGGTTPPISRDGVERHAPVSFLDAIERHLCLFFADEPMAPAGPDMPVCGAPRQTFSRKPYCEACLRREAPAEGRKVDRPSGLLARPAGGPDRAAVGAAREAIR